MHATLFSKPLILPSSSSMARRNTSSQHLMLHAVAPRKYSFFRRISRFDEDLTFVEVPAPWLYFLTLVQNFHVNNTWYFKVESVYCFASGHRITKKDFLEKNPDKLLVAPPFYNIFNLSASQRQTNFSYLALHSTNLQAYPSPNTAQIADLNHQIIIRLQSTLPRICFGYDDLSNVYRSILTSDLTAPLSRKECDQIFHNVMEAFFNRIANHELPPRLSPLYDHMNLGSIEDMTGTESDNITMQYYETWETMSVEDVVKIYKTKASSSPSAMSLSEFDKIISCIKLLPLK